MEKTLSLPQLVEIQNALAWVLATTPDQPLRNGAKAVEYAERANQLCEEKNPMVLDTLGAAYAEIGKYKEAVQTMQKAVELAKRQGRENFFQQLQERLKLYQAGRPFYEKPSGLTP